MKTIEKNKKQRLSQRVEGKEKRKLKSLQQDKQSAWHGFGLFGIVGWSVVVPTLSGIMLGIWLDREYPQSFSWTISLLFVGLFIGCMLAWHWVNKENRRMHDNNKNHE